MKLLIAQVFGTALLIGIASCSTMEVSTAKAPNVDLTHYKTYSWITGQTTAPMASGRPVATILDQTVKASVDRQMAAKGFVRSTGESPDLLVSYVTTTAIDETQATYSNYGWDWGGLAPPPVREGTLSLQLIDPRTNRVVWNGSATDVIGHAGDESQKQIAEAVKDIFKEYPAG